MALSLLQNYTKLIYGKPIEVLAEENTISEALPFTEAERTGDKYVVPVRMADESGITYNSAHDGFTILPAIDGDVQRAELEGAEILGRSQISYGNMSKLSESNSESRKAYKQAVGDTIESLMNQMERRRELALMYGPGSNGAASLGVVNTIVSAVGTALTVTLTRASWAAGIWNVLKGSTFDFHTSGGTSHTSNAAMVLSGVVQSQCRLSFTGNATDVAAVAPGDLLTFRGSRTVSCVGVQGILENAGVLHGINAALYPQWRAGSYNVAGAFTFDKAVEGIAKVADNGLEEGGTLFTSSKAWTDLMTDEAALRRHVGDKMSSSLKTGASSLEFESVGGVLKIVKHKYMKQGQAWFIASGQGKRVGSREVSFKLPGHPNDWFFVEVADRAASEIRCYGDMAPFFERPNLCVLYTGISSTSDDVPS